MKAAILRKLAESLERRELVAVATVIAGPGAGRQLLVGPGERRIGGLGSEPLDARAAEIAAEAFDALASTRAIVEVSGDEIDLFVEVHPPPPRLVVVGAVHVAVHLVHFARRLGFETIVVDPRTAFATPERFAHADRLVTEWPQEALPGIGLDENGYLAVLSHDLKIDLPALVWALGTPARYVGALGSKKTHAKRTAALVEAGVSQTAIGRIHAPIGIDLGGRRAEEIALSVMAEIVAARYGRA